MSYIVHSLELHRDIVLPPEGNAADGTSEILEYRSPVGTRDLEPDPADHLLDGKSVSVIPAGSYLFAQGTMDENSSIAEMEGFFREAAETVWLEAIWREAQLKDDRILVRILSEDSKQVFQIFRGILETR